MEGCSVLARGIISQNQGQVTQAGSLASEPSMAGTAVGIDWVHVMNMPWAVLRLCIPRGSGSRKPSGAMGWSSGSWVGTESWVGKGS